MRLKKSQIKMGETIAILVIFFFLLVFGFSFYVRMQKQSFKRLEQKQLDLKAVQIAQKASFFPELQCSFKNVMQDNCFDLLKMEAFNSTMGNEDIKADYYDDFEYSDIRATKIYPPPIKTYPLYENSLAGSSINLSTRVPISLYNATSKQYYFGMLEVFTYSAK